MTSKSRRASRASATATVRSSLGSFAYRGRAILVAVLLLASLLFSAVVAWRQWSPAIGNRDEYAIAANVIHISPPPTWLKADIVSQTFEDAGLTGTLSLFDDDLTEQLVEALELHPWIDRVTRLEKNYPARIEAEVTYRLPIASVEATGDHQTAPYPIDATGVRLPAGDVPPSMLLRLPRVVDAGQLPLVGQAINGPRIAGALALIQFLQDEWDMLSLLNVTPLSKPESHGEVKFYLYDLTTSGGTRIHWGAAPNASPAEESAPLQKLSRLKRFVEANRVDLKSVEAPEIIDVRRSLRIKPRDGSTPGSGG